MKKLLSLILCAVLALALGAPALADLIWEPDDDFYTEHRDECEYVDTDYEAWTDTEAREDPESDDTVRAVASGERLFISYIWHGETDWGYAEALDGWVPMVMLRRLYDAATFTAAHESEFVERAGTVSRAENGTVYVWTFPGSGKLAGTIDNGFDWSEDDPAYAVVWTDEDGLEWGRIDYYYAIRGWVCLSEPGADDLPVTVPMYADGGEEGSLPEVARVYMPSGRTTAQSGGLGLVTILVMVVCAAAAIVIMLGFVRDNRRAKKG